MVVSGATGGPAGPSGVGSVTVPIGTEGERSVELEQRVREIWDQLAIARRHLGENRTVMADRIIANAQRMLCGCADTGNGLESSGSLWFAVSQITDQKQSMERGEAKEAVRPRRG